MDVFSFKPGLHSCSRTVVLWIVTDTGSFGLLGCVIHRARGLALASQRWLGEIGGSADLLLFSHLSHV